MFEALKNDKFDEFLQVYQAFREATHKINELLLEGKDDPMTRLRHAKLTVKVDKMWSEFDAEKKDKLTDLLILKKMLPEEVRKVLNIFGGEVKLT